VTRRIPVLVVSGFLGSGKTTLVRRVLADARRTGRRVAVVSNEFGELGIDQALFGDGGAAYVELEGGCVCCRLSDRLVETLQTLFERARPDRVVVETSGVALPFDVQLQFWREPVARWVEDDVAVVVVNAEQLRDARDLDATFAQQVSSADLLLLNQLDRVGAAEVPRLEAALRELEPEAPIVRCVRCGVEPALLFPPDPDGLRARRREAGGDAPAHGHEQFASEELRFERGVAPEAVLERVREAGALRAKGFVATSQGLRLVQGVGPRV
jgi:G3E family GTPase